MERGKTIRICKRCMKSWNVSRIDPPWEIRLYLPRV